MILRNNSNKEIKLNWTPGGIFRRYSTVFFPAAFSHDSRVIHIDILLNCRLLPAVNILCSHIADTLLLSIGKKYCLKPNSTLFRQRVLESNQFDNLSPPFIINFSKPYWLYKLN